MYWMHTLVVHISCKFLTMLCFGMFYDDDGISGMSCYPCVISSYICLWWTDFQQTPFVRKEPFLYVLLTRTCFIPGGCYLFLIMESFACLTSAILMWHFAISVAWHEITSKDSYDNVMIFDYVILLLPLTLQGTKVWTSSTHYIEALRRWWQNQLIRPHNQQRARLVSPPSYTCY